MIEVGLRDGRRLRVGPLICYDAVSPRLAREEVELGAEVLVKLSNDSWFAEGGGPLLYLAVATVVPEHEARTLVLACAAGIAGGRRRG